MLHIINHQENASQNHKEGWEGNSGGKVLAAQARGPEVTHVKVNHGSVDI